MLWLFSVHANTPFSHFAPRISFNSTRVRRVLPHPQQQTHTADRTNPPVSFRLSITRFRFSQTG